MTRYNHWKALLLLVLASWYPSHEASAWEIGVDCYVIPLPPAGRPVENYLCQYSWGTGGDPMNYIGYVSQTTKWYDSPGYGFPTLDYDYIDNFAFGNATSPIEFWIQCSDYTGTMWGIMHGWLKRYYVGGINGGGGGTYVDKDHKSDDAYPILMNPPNAPCL